MTFDLQWEGISYLLQQSVLPEEVWSVTERAYGSVMQLAEASRDGRKEMRERYLNCVLRMMEVSLGWWLLLLS